LGKHRQQRRPIELSAANVITTPHPDEPRSISIGCRVSRGAPESGQPKIDGHVSPSGAANARFLRSLLPRPRFFPAARHASSIFVLTATVRVGGPWTAEQKGGQTPFNAATPPLFAEARRAKGRVRGPRRHRRFSHRTAQAREKGLMHFSVAAEIDCSCDSKKRALASGTSPEGPGLCWLSGSFQRQQTEVRITGYQKKQLRRTFAYDGNPVGEWLEMAEAYGARSPHRERAPWRGGPFRLAGRGGGCSRREHGLLGSRTSPVVRRGSPPSCSNMFRAGHAGTATMTTRPSRRAHQGELSGRPIGRKHICKQGRASVAAATECGAAEERGAGDARTS